MKINEIINEGLVCLDLKALNKNDTFFEMTQYLLDQKIIINQNDYINALIEREKVGSTYCGFDIAIPHGICSTVTKPTMCFARTKGFCWDGDDESPINYIFMLAIPLEDVKNENIHLKLLSQIAISALDNDLRASWEHVKSPKEFIETLNKYNEEELYE